MIGRGANGPVCYGTPRNTRIWLSRCVILSSAKVASTNAPRGLLDVWGEVGKVAQLAGAAGPHISLLTCVTRSQYYRMACKTPSGLPDRLEKCLLS